MPSTQQLPPNMFVLEGLFLGYLSPKKKKIKALILAVDQEQCVIKLPKEVRAALQSYQLQPGEPIRCIGRSRVDFKTGMIKLRAYQVLRLPPSTEDTQIPAPPEAPISTIVTSPRVLTPPVSVKQQQAKILICRKSGCRKRGGRQLVAVLEKLLREHQLQDRVEIQSTGCQKRCSKAPTLTIMPGKHRYDGVALKSLPHLVEKHFYPAKPCLTSDPVPDP
ncbi:MAG: (2Fe-2S) ferredoxin domain-containing protein [Leptolyngbyaceae cyanobacterium]